MDNLLNLQTLGLALKALYIEDWEPSSFDDKSASNQEASPNRTLAQVIQLTGVNPSPEYFS